MPDDRDVLVAVDIATRELKARITGLQDKLDAMAQKHHLVCDAKDARIEDLEQDVRMASVTVRMWMDKFRADRAELSKLMKLWRETPLCHRDGMKLCAAELQAHLESTDVAWGNHDACS